MLFLSSYSPFWAWLTMGLNRRDEKLSTHNLEQEEAGTDLTEKKQNCSRSRCCLKNLKTPTHINIHANSPQVGNQCGVLEKILDRVKET